MKVWLPLSSALWVMTAGNKRWKARPLTMVYYRNLLLVTLVGVVLVICAACDGSIKAKGKVYARKTPIGKSEAFVDESFPDSSQLTPVKDATVTLYHGRNYSQESIDKSTGMHDSTKTDGNGAFELHRLTAPYSFHAALVVEKEGYESITKIFLHKSDPHEVVVVLAPAESIPK